MPVAKQPRLTPTWEGREPVRRALAAIAVAERSSSLDRESQRDLVDWARRTSIDAFAALEADQTLWGALAPAADRSRPRTPDTVQQAKDLLAAAVADTLVEHGFQEPPPVGELVMESRRAVETAAAVHGVPEPTADDVKAACASLRMALQSSAARPTRTRKLLRRSKKVLVSLAALSLPAFAGAVADDVWDCAKAGQVRLICEGAAPETGGEDPILDRLARRERRANAREAEARAEEAAARAELARLEVKEARRRSR